MSSSVAASRPRRVGAAAAARADPEADLARAERRAPRAARRQEQEDEEDNREAAAAPPPRVVSAAAAKREAAAAKRAATAAKKAAADARAQERKYPEPSDDEESGDDPDPIDIQALVDRRVAEELARRAQVDSDARLARQMDALVASASNSSSRGSSSHKGQAPKGANLDKYEGAGGLELDSWIVRQTILLELFDGLSSAQAVTWLATAMKGAAVDWYVSEYKPRVTVANPASPASLFSGLRKRFQPIDSTETALRDLFALKQDKLSVDEYTTRFRQLTGHLPKLDSVTAMFMYRAGLRKNLADRIAEMSPQPLTLEEIIATAARLDGRKVAGVGLAAVELRGDDPNALYTQEQVNAMIQGAMSAQTAAGARQPPGGPATYDSRTDRGANKRSKITPVWKAAGLSEEEGKRRREHNLCMGCAKTGHIYRDCPSRAAKGQGQGN